MALTVTINAKDRLTGVLGSIGKGIKGVAFGFGNLDRIMRSVLVGTSIKLASDMDKGLREVGTLLGGLTDNQMKSMTAELENIASSTGAAMSKLTKAKYDIVSAGFTSAAESAKLLAASADLAVGGVTEVSIAADLLTTTINSYNLAADDAVEVSDKLFTVVRLGKTTMNELGGSMGRVLAIAGEAGVSLDEVGAALAVLTARGQDTAEATTAIRAAITSIFKPTTDLQGVIESLGFSTGKAMLEQIGMAESLKLITDAAAKQKLPMETLFTNIRAMQSVLPLTGKAARDFEKALYEMERATGATSTAVAEMRKSFALDMSKMKENANNILRAIGRSLISVIQPKVKEANKILSELGRIGWDEIGKTVIDNWSLTLDAAKKLFTVFTQALVPLTKTAFFKIGSVAIAAMKLAFSAGAFSVSELLFGGKKKANMAKLVKKFGDDAVGNFVESIEAGKADISLLDPDAAIQDIEIILNKINDRFVAGSGLIVANAENTGRLLAQALGDSASENLSGFLADGDLFDPSNLSDSVDAAETILVDFYNKIIALNTQAAIASGKLPPPDFEPTFEAYEAIKTGHSTLFDQLKANNSEFTLDYTNMWNNLVEISNIYFDGQVSKTQESLAAITEAYALSTEQIAAILTEWDEAQKEMNTLSFEEQKLQIDSMADKRKIAVASQIKDEVLLAAEIKKIDKAALEDKKKIENAKQALIHQGFQNAASAITSLASINKGASKANFMVWKRAAQAQAVVDTYAGATAAYKSLAGIPIIGPFLGAAAAAAAIAGGLANVAKIESQSMIFGGSVKPIPGGDSVPVNLNPREKVATAAASEQYGSEIDQMNQTAEGGSGSGFREQITIHAVDSESLEDALRRNPVAIRNAIQEIKEDGFLTGVIE